MLNLISCLLISQSPQLEIDPLLLVQVNEVWSVIGRANNSVWPGWDARKTPILIYLPGKQDVLINHPHPPAGFVRYEGAVKSPIGPIYVKNGPTLIDLDGQNTTRDVGGIRTLVVADTLSTRRQWVEGLSGSVAANPNDAKQIISNSLYPNPYSAMAVFAHEAFHVYQEALAPKKAGNERTLLKYPSLSVENNVGTAMESDYLADALKATSDKELRDFGIKWLAVRNWRRSFLSKEDATYEDATEFSEGTAKFIEYRLLAAMAGRQPAKDAWLMQGFRGYSELETRRDQMVKQMQGFMTGANVVNNDPYGASGIRFRLYFSGMGISALLDRLGAKWNDRVLKTDASLTSLARDALRPTEAELNEALASVKSSPRFEFLTKEKTRIAEEGKIHIQKVLDSFSEAPGELVIDYSGLVDPVVNFTYTSFGILKVDDDRGIYRLIPISGNIGSLSFSEDGPRPVLHDQKLKQVRLQLTSPLTPESLGPDLKLPGVTIKNFSGTLSREGKRLVLKLSA